MRSIRNQLYILLFLLLFCLQYACVPSKRATVGAAASLLQDVAKSARAQSDLRMVREGMPAYLMLLDGMLETFPDNEELLISAAECYSSFATLARGEDVDYARLLYSKGKEYALRALHQRGFEKPAQRPLEDFTRGLDDLAKEDVPYLFWAAACWGNWISVNLDSMAALAELPRVHMMMERVLELDEGFYYGGPHLFMGIWYASRPRMSGGDLGKAQQHFLRALDLGEGKFLMTHVYYASHYARRRFDKGLFVSTLLKVVETPADVVPELTLLNTMAQAKAKALLGRADEFFE